MKIYAPILLFLIFGFVQNTNTIGKTIQRYSYGCIDYDSSTSLITALGTSPLDCANNSARNEKVRLKKSYNSSDFFLVEYQKDERISTWYNEDVHALGNNEYLKWLAIAFRKLKLIQLEQEGIVVLGGELNGKNGLWVLKVDPNRPEDLPLENLIVDLNGMPSATPDFIAYLLRRDNYQASALPQIVKSWANSDGKKQLTIKAILPKVEGEDQPKVKGFGSQEFERNFHLPDTIDFEAIKASYEQGVLTVLLPKTDPKPQSRSISVQ